MLYSGIQCDLSSMMQLIRRKLMKEKTEYLLEKEETAEYEALFAGGIKNYISSVAPAVSYTDQKECLALLLLLFGSVEELKAELVTASLQSDFNQVAADRFEMLSPWREDILELKCTVCGFRFFTTPYRLISGWGCPNCDRELSDDAMFQRLFDSQNDGTYTLCSEFLGLSKHITLHHNTCGSTYKIRARNFIIENARCECEYMISEEQARTAIESFGEFELLTFESTSAPVQIRHLKCKRAFSWNYYGFLQHPWCKLCSPSVSGQDMFIREMKELVGNEYTLMDNYVDRTSKVRMRHNQCNCTHEYLPARFLDGGRCSKCTPEYTRAEFARVVREISLGRYVWNGPKTNNLEIVLDTATGDEKYLSQARILQELMRPTPSPILPLKEKNLNVALPVTNAESVFAWLCEHYTQSELISLEDIKIDGLSYAVTKNAAQTLVEDGKLIRVTSGLFSFPNFTFSPYEIMAHKYLIRNGKRIGYLKDHSFAYELGLREKMPQRISIATNQESQRHGRSRTFLGMDLKLHGSSVPIDNKNYPILTVLSFLINEKRLKCCTQGDKNQAIQKWLTEKNIVAADFEEYYQYFPSWSKKMIESIYLEDTV